MTSEILIQIVIGGLLGMTGQSLRIIVGVKKLNDKAAKKQVPVQELIVPSAIGISLIIGFCAGVLAIISVSTFKPDFLAGTDAKQIIITIIGAGYAGTDFIEGFMSKYLPNTDKDTVIPDSYANTQPRATVKHPEVPPQGGADQP